MKYCFFLLILLCSTNIFAQIGYQRQISTNIEERTIFLSNRISMQSIDRETSTITYDGYQTSFENIGAGPNKGQIILQPFVTLNAITGQSDFHMWVGYRPPYGPTGATSTIKPKYLSILSAKNKLTLPLLYYNVSFPSSDAVLKPGAPSAVHESAYTILSADDLTTLMSIAYEGTESTVEVWEPTAVLNKLQQQASSFVNEEMPSKRSIQEFVAFQQQQGQDTSYVSLDRGVFSPSLPIMVDQKALSIVLTGNDALVNIDVPHYQFTPILEMVDLFYAISNRTIEIP
ncbi:MAG: hypothetical protein ACRC9L_00620 [Brevinema sp.]